MEYRRIGRSGLKISALSLGGRLTRELSEQSPAQLKLVEAAIERGVNHLDIADIYGGGEAERACGALLKRLPRGSLILSTKCYWPMSEGLNDRGLSRKHIIESVEGSLRRLGVDHIDLFFCQLFDEETPLEETLRALEDLIRQGKVHYWGTSSWSASQLYEAHSHCQRLGAYAPIAEQSIYSLLERGVEHELLPTLRSLGMGLIAWSPLAGGVLSGNLKRSADRSKLDDERRRWLSAWLDEESSACVEGLAKLARELEATPSQLALAWALRRREVSSLMVGVSSEAQLEEDLKALELAGDQELWSRLDAL